MNDVATNTDLVVIEPSNALVMFTTDGGLDPLLKRIRSEIDACTADVSTPKGRKAIASMAHKVARSKTYIDNAGKTLVAEQKKIPNLIDASRREMRKTLETWQSEVRAPLDAWEAAEDERIKGHTDAIAWLAEMAATSPAEVTTENIKGRLLNVSQVVIGTACEEFLAQYEAGKSKAITALTEALAMRRKSDADQAELERLRLEAAERGKADRERRIAEEAAARATKEAEAKAEAASAAAEAQARRMADDAAARELALQRQIEAEKQRAAAEAARLAREAEQKAQREAAEARHREADQANRAAKHRAALEAFQANGIDTETARRVITLIANQKIPSMVIQY